MDQATADSKIKICLANQDNAEALACLFKTIEEVGTSAPCSPRMVMLTQEGCPFCEDEKLERKTELEKGLIETVDIHTARGRSIAKRNGIDFTPAVLLLDCHDTIIPDKTP